MKNYVPTCEGYLNFTILPGFRQEKFAAALAAAKMSLRAEGLAVGALIHGGVCLVGTYQDMLQRAVVFVVTVVCALGNGTLDASVCMAAHTWFLLCIEFGFSLTRKQESILEIKPIYTWWKGKQSPFLYDLFLTDFLGGN